jgi:extracellular matrix regulatory protein A
MDGSKSKWAGRMEPLLLNVGFGSTVVADRVIGIIPPHSAPIKRLKDEARDASRLVDATHGRKTRSVIIMDSNHVVLSAIQAETMAQRFIQLKERDGGGDEAKS